MRRLGRSLTVWALGMFILFLLVGTIFYFAVVPMIASYFQQPVAPTAPKYTTGLKVLFDIYDKTTSSMITSDVNVLFYALGTNPFAYTFISGNEISSAVYDSVKGQWKAVLDAGKYVVLVKDVATSKTKYPEMITATVEGTDSDSREVVLDPAMIKMVHRASVSISVTIKAYNSTSGAYDISVSDMNITTYDKWLVTFTFTVSGTNKVIKPGRIYLTKIPGLLPEKAYLDGKQVSIIEDTDGSDDGMTGYYVEFTEEWRGGEVHRLDVYFKDVGASTGTMTLTLFDYYSCLNIDLRWWKEETASVAVVS